MIRLIQSYESAPYKFFTPNGKIEQFIKAVGEAPKTGKRILFLSAGNGVGKTAALINILANIFFETNERWFNYPLYTERWKLPKTFWFITKDSTLQETIEPEIIKWFPPNRYSTSNKGKNHIYELKTDTGFNVFFKTIDQDPDTFESATLGCITLDEPPPEHIYKACVSRLRAGGYIITGLTPLHKAAWMLDKLILNHKIQEHLFLLYGEIWDNSIKKGIRGRLTENNINFMISQWDAEEIDARTKGLFTHLKGLVYKDYIDSEPYLIDDFDYSDKTQYQVICVIDPHDRRYPAIGWYAIDRAGQYYIVHEWPNLQEFNGRYYDDLGDTRYTFKEITAVIKRVEEENKMNVVWRKIDPNKGKTPYGNTGLTVQEEFEVEGMYFDADVNDDRAVGHNIVRDLLKVGNFNKPRLQVCKSCNNHRWSFMRYMYDDYTGKRAYKKSASEDVLDKGKDFMDIIRYFAVGNHGFRHDIAAGRTGWREKIWNKRSKISGYMGV